MSRIAYVNGRFAPLAKASISIQDRGFQFADGVYEVMAVIGGAMLDLDLHFARLERSLAEVRMTLPMTRAALAVVLRETIRRNLVSEGIVYLQITRGIARRDHAFPAAAIPTIIVTARSQPVGRGAHFDTGVAIITLPDQRWARCDIKSVGLLPNALAKQSAKEAGAYEAWLVGRDGLVTEGTSTNAWILTPQDELKTRYLDHAILSGVTRLAVLELARIRAMKVVEGGFSVQEAKDAKEAFLTSTTSFVLPVVSIDGSRVGEGAPGAVAKELRRLFAAHAQRQVLAANGLAITGGNA
jgi:D-alanine transaminase